jgi:hypothetical protein
MTADILTLPRVSTLEATPRPRRSMDLGYSSLVLLQRLRDSLLASEVLIQVMHKAEEKRRRHSPSPLFFFNRQLQSELEKSRPAKPDMSAFTKSHPAESLAYRQLPDLLDDVNTLMSQVEVRRAARSSPGLMDVLGRLTSAVPGTAKLHALLSRVVDDQILTVINPRSRTGVKFVATGVADVAQLQVLFTEFQPGRKPDDRIITAYLGGNPHPNANTFTTSQQLFKPTALQPDGRVNGCEHWCHPDDSLNTVPLVQGERVMLIGEAVVPRTWAVGRAFPMVAGDLELVKRMDRAEVTAWLSARCPQLPREKPLARVA